MSELLLCGRYLIAEPAALPGGGMIENGAALCVAGRVAEVGGREALERAHPEAPVIGSSRHLVIPGLINAHHHGRGLNSFRLGALDNYLEAWVADFFSQKPLDAYLDSLHANLNLLRAGVTTVLHHAYPREPENFALELSDTLHAYAQTGQRVALAPVVSDRNPLVLDRDDSFLAALPPALARRARKAFPPNGESEGYFDMMAALAQEHGDAERVRLLYGPDGPEWCSDRLLEEVRDAAEEAAAGIHIHCLESPLQRQYAARLHGRGSAEHLDALGLLGPATSLGHGCWLGEREIALLAESGVSVCHNASSNLRLRCGIAPVAAMLEAGVNVAIGLDGNALNGDDDFIQEMRLVYHLHRLPRGLAMPPPPDPFAVLRMATAGGARATGFGEQRLGRLGPGACADAVFIDLEKLGAPYLDPAIDPIAALVYLAKPAQIDHVVIAGEAVIEDGRLADIDEDDIARRLGESAAASAGERHQALRRLMAELKPHIAAFYAQWPDTLGFDPFYTVNSR